MNTLKIKIKDITGNKTIKDWEDVMTDIQAFFINLFSFFASYFK